MENIDTLLLGTPLFSGITAEQLRAFLACIRPVRRCCEKGTCLLSCGEVCRSIGVVLSGRIEAYRPMPSGGHIPMATMGPGGIFGDVLSGATLKSPVTVVAAESCEVLLLPCAALAAPCTNACFAHRQFTQNLLCTVGQKYFSLLRRIEILAMHTLRGKISAWLLAEAEAQGSDVFRVHGTRAHLADYLGCDRSALSRELSHMRADALIETYRGSFRLLDKAALEQLCQN